MIDKKLIKDLFFRQQRVQNAIHDAGFSGMLLSTDINIYYLTGLVFSGYYYLPVDDEPLFFIRRPAGLSGERIFSIGKPEQIPEIMQQNGFKMPENVLLETDEISYNEYVRLQNIFHFRKTENASTLLREIRVLKSAYEISLMRISADKQAAVYARIPECYRPDMTDLRLQAEIEYRMRLNGSTGILRTFGKNMNVFNMGSLLAGANAEVPSPFDFALGGGGQSALSPIGAGGIVLKKGMAVMIDMAGNYTDYVSDMTRVYSIGKLPDLALRAHDVALQIQYAIEDAAKPGTPCAELYNLAFQMVEQAGLTGYFMGTRQQAKFVGHGIGLELNESPVLTPRSKDVLRENMIIAVEPKFVIPRVGAVGVENTFLVTKTGLEKLTSFNEEIIPLE
ncbi:MAG: Xaa-Pro peptidase family protein [Tannerella sp.]|jgi:Xaa-Pro aminopeptidase|nr:Xaa-Pro peptidase family protein [Tannerella sp.]